MSLVEIVEGERRQLTTRVDEAQQILRGVIGLSREQFTSVVLLPQGEFARFLKASSNDREAILRQLFNTHRFDEIGDYLNARAKKLRGTVETDQERRQTLRAGLIETAETYRADEHESHTEEPELDALDDETLVDHVDGIMTQLEAAALRRVEDFTKTREAARKRGAAAEQTTEQVHEAGEYRRHEPRSMTRPQPLRPHNCSWPIISVLNRCSMPNSTVIPPSPNLLRP